MSTSQQRGKEYFETMRAINPTEKKVRNCLKIFNVHKYARKELKLILPLSLLAGLKKSSNSVLCRMYSQIQK